MRGQAWVDDVFAETTEASEDVVEVRLAWGDATLATTHVRAGRPFVLGEDATCDGVVPAELLGAARAVLVAWDVAGPALTPPRGALTVVDERIVDAPVVRLVRGQASRVTLGPLVLDVAVVVAGRKPGASLAAALRDAGIGGVAFSALVHASLFVSLAYFLPPLGATLDDGISRDQILTMRRLLDASAEPERLADDATSPASTGGAASAPSGGAQALGAAGAMGRPQVTTHGRWSAAGDAPRNEVTLSRAEKAALAQDFGLLGLLATSGLSDPNAPVVPWGTTTRGADAASHVGAMWGADIGDALGVRGLSFAGLEEGGRGNEHAIGLDDVGGLAHSLALRSGEGDQGIGCAPGAHCAAHVNGNHRSTFAVRMPRDIETNGRIPAEIIQRIVRQNAGRYRLCYEAGLRGNPALEGRVGVQFLIDRNGAVSVAQDAGSDLPDLAVRRCVVQSFYSLSFPPPAGGTVTVRYPLVFTPG